MSTFPDQLFQLGGVPVGNLNDAGVGDVFWVVSSGSAADTLMATRNIRTDKIFTSIATAYAATTTKQNDVILVTQGNYLETATLDWAKDNVHLIGVGGPVSHSDWTLTGTSIYTTGTSVDYVIDMSGERNTIRNLAINNYGANAACLSAIRVSGYGNGFFNSAFMGTMTSTQAATSGASSVDIAKGGHYLYFENCTIGQSEWGTRSSTTSGVLNFSGTSSPPPTHGHFKNCQFLSSAATAGVPMVYMASNQSCGRLWRFTNCLFYNFWANWGGMCSSVFQNPASGQSTCSMVLEGCTSVGYTEWQQREFAGTTYTNEGWVMSAMPLTATAGGLSKIPTGTVGA